ncbi:uncharacterized protein LOC117333305 [Pecten maximus]|uniref:uncharacterized protein LOC117333305 n=1 Tax=Pecten maximus TaxID=6579 RepID=UPI0014589CAA|nr:uncharacterized protein LOC117333305 [Pecten maximus]
MYKKIEELDLILTYQGKYGGSLQNLERTESSTARKKRIQLESEEERLRSSIEKAFNTYKSLISSEISSRKNFLKTMSVIRDQSSVLEKKRLKVVAQAYRIYISLLETAEHLNPRRESILQHMRSMASAMIDVQTNMFRQWAKDRIRRYRFELFTDDWTQYGLGIVTNNVPDVEIPANLHLLSESDKTDSSTEERSGQSQEDFQNTNKAPDVHLANISDGSDQATNHANEGPEQSLPKKASTDVDDPGRGPQGAIPKVRCQTDKNEDSPAIRHKANRRQIGPKPVVMQPPPKSSTDGWKATQTPIGNLTLPAKSDGKVKRKSQNADNDGVTHVSSEKEPEDTKTPEKGGKRSQQSANDQAQKDTASSASQDPLEWKVWTGTDHPYYTPGDPSDLETYVLPEGTTKRPEAPFPPMINNWMDPDILPLEPNSSAHNLLSQFLAKTKAKFRPSKKARKLSSPEIESGPIPFDFGYDDVDEVSTPINTASHIVNKGDQVPPPTPGTSQSVEKSGDKKAASGSESSDADIETLASKRHSVKAVKMYSITGYEANTENEISFLSGQTVKLLFHANSKGMAYGYTRSSRMKPREYGFFPESHVVRTIEERNRSLRRNVSGFFKKR